MQGYDQEEKVLRKEIITRVGEQSPTLFIFECIVSILKSDASKFVEGFVTNSTVGNMTSGTDIANNSTITDVVKSMICESDPNKRYDSKYLGMWSTTSDVDSFLLSHNHDNNYEGLALGNYVMIPYERDTSYIWEIAGFDCEYNQTAADGTTYNNGYGILMIPKGRFVSGNWNASSTLDGGYISSTIHTTTLVTIGDNIRNTLGNHMIQRNVLLSDSYNASGEHLYYDTMNTGTAGSYAWTTSYLTLMSVGQLTGIDFGRRHNQYDDGEANYKLPLFNYENWWVSDNVMRFGYDFLTRNIYGQNRGGSYYYTWLAVYDGRFSSFIVNSSETYRPVMLIR